MNDGPAGGSRFNYNLELDPGQLAELRIALEDALAAARRDAEPQRTDALEAILAKLPGRHGPPSGPLTGPRALHHAGDGGRDGDAGDAPAGEEGPTGDEGPPAPPPPTIA